MSVEDGHQAHAEEGLHRDQAGRSRCGEDQVEDDFREPLVVQPEPSRGEVRERIRQCHAARLPDRLAELDVAPQIRIRDRGRKPVESDTHHDGDDGERLP